MCAAAGVVAGFAQHVLWLFIVAVVVGTAAFLILLVAGVPDLVYWIRAQIDRQKAQDLEVIVRRRFVVDWDNRCIRLVEAEAIVQNNSLADIAPSRMVLKPANFRGDAKQVGGLLPETIGAGRALSCKIQQFDFSDILGRTSSFDLPNMPMFSVSVEIGYGSRIKNRASKPFPLRPKTLKSPTLGGSSEWTE